MKIYEIGTGYTPIPAKMSAATEIVVEELTKAFLALDVDARIVDIKADDRPATSLPITEVWVPKAFSGTDIKLGLAHKLKRVVYSLCLAKTLQTILKNAKETVVLHFHNQYNLFFFLKLTPVKLRRRAVIAYTNHSGIWRLPWEQIRQTIQNRYFQEAECMKRADIVFVLNEETRENAVRHLDIPVERFVLIGNGVNPRIYHPLSAEEKTAAKQAFGLSGKRVLLQVGSVYENKGQCRALALLLPTLKEDPDMLYLYAGGIVSEEYHQQLIAMAKAANVADQVRYLGNLTPGEELNQVYNLADATICASEYEGFSLVIPEAMSAGIPVLIHKASPFSVGSGCIPYDEESFGQALGALLSDPENTAGKAARENVLNHYSWEITAKAYLTQFQRETE